LPVDRIDIDLPPKFKRSLLPAMIYPLLLFSPLF